jgi:DNA/RNA endonuclease G (NUC1)
MKKILILLLFTLTSIICYGQEVIKIKKEIFEVHYSEDLEQPVWLQYRSTNRPKNVSRTGLDFYTEPNIKTSDDKDYVKNVYDKGHIAPAATFSDNMENLKQTFTYLNCVLQHEKLNRGEWAKLEDQERKWDDEEPLTIYVNVIFDKTPKRLSTNAAIPTQFEKHIYFEEKKIWKCFLFPNESPKFVWSEYQINCNH